MPMKIDDIEKDLPLLPGYRVRKVSGFKFNKRSFLKFPPLRSDQVTIELKL